VNFRAKRSLPPDRGYGLYMEAGASSVRTFWSLWLRTLVVDEG